MASPFLWSGNTGQIRTPEQAAEARSVASALAGSRGRVATNGWEGLAQVANALSERAWRDEAANAEAAGRERAGELFADLAVNADPNSIIAALTSPDAAWASPAQTSIASALLNSGLERQDPMYQAQLAKLQAEASGGGAPEYFGSTLPYQDAEGNLGYIQLNKGGLPSLPEGARWLEPTSTVNTGTAQTVIGRNTGEVQSAIPIDLRGAESEQAIGAAEGAATVAAPGDVASGEMALDLLDQIENNPELPWATGQSVQFGGNTGLIPGTQGRMDFQNLVNQATSGAFLTAIGEMRGLGSLSNAEGQTATAAVTRMNTATSEGAFRKALADYKEVIQRGLERARSRLPDSGGAQQSAPTVRVFNPATGRLE